MKLIFSICLFAMLALPLQLTRAQDKPQEKPKQEEHPKAGVPVKVQILFTEFDGDKKLASMPYSFTVTTDDRPAAYGPSAASLRTGVRIPVEVDGKDQKTQYIDVGSKIDCGIRPEDDGRFHVYLSFERSALYPNKSGEGERLVPEPNGQPLLRQFLLSDNLIMKDGQTSDSISSTDPATGHIEKIAVTINVQK